MKTLEWATQAARQILDLQTEPGAPVAVLARIIHEKSLDDSLIAAAPSLLAALIRLLETMGDACGNTGRIHTEVSCSICNARRAIADAQSGAVGPTCADCGEVVDLEGHHVCTKANADPRDSRSTSAEKTEFEISNSEVCSEVTPENEAIMNEPATSPPFKPLPAITPTDTLCPECKGMGFTGEHPKECPACKGTGHQLEPFVSPLESQRPRCEYPGSAGCDMLPSGVRRRVCDSCKPYMKGGDTDAST